MMPADYNVACGRWTCDLCGFFLRDEPDTEIGLGWSFGEEPRDNVYEVAETRICRNCDTRNENRGERVCH